MKFSLVGDGLVRSSDRVTRSDRLAKAKVIRFEWLAETFDQILVQDRRGLADLSAWTSVDFALELTTRDD